LADQTVAANLRDWIKKFSATVVFVELAEKRESVDGREGGATVVPDRAERRESRAKTRRPPGSPAAARSTTRERWVDGEESGGAGR
jgi:hypothetical protein